MLGVVVVVLDEPRLVAEVVVVIVVAVSAAKSWSPVLPVAATVSSPLLGALVDVFVTIFIRSMFSEPAPFQPLIGPSVLPLWPGVLGAALAAGLMLALNSQPRPPV